MILSRVTGHLKKQHWTAVFLDFIILVVGVFIGLQVNNWNQERVERAEAAASLNLLKEDFLTLRAQTERSMERHEINSAAVARLIKGARLKHFDDATLDDDLLAAIRITSPSGRSAAYAELVASGRLKLIGDPKLRRALRDYDGYASLVLDNYQMFYEPLNRVRERLLSAITIDVDAPPSTEIGKPYPIASVDREMLANDPSIMAALQNALHIQRNIYAVLKTCDDRINGIIAMIEAEPAK
jgi:hypothetical protein